MGDQDGPNPLFDYLGATPKKLSWRHIVSLKYIGAITRRTCYLLLLPFVLYEDSPVHPKDLPEPASEVVFTDEHFELAKKLESSAERRREILEQKAGKTLGVLVFLAPLLVSVVAFVSRVPDQVSVLVVVFFSLTGVCFVAGFIAAFRAVAIRYSQKLGIGAIFDPKKEEWLQLPKQKFARGLIWCAAWNEAMNDHVADFVRSARLYTVAGMLFLMAAALPILRNQIHSPPSNDQNVALKSMGTALGNLTHTIDSLSEEMKRPVPTPETVACTVFKPGTNISHTPKTRVAQKSVNCTASNAAK